jgi:hypothetical protein
MNTAQLIELLQPSEVLSFGSNFLSCIINDKLCDFQIDYKNSRRWYQFEYKGKAIAPREIFIKYID